MFILNTLINRKFLLKAIDLNLTVKKPQASYENSAPQKYEEVEFFLAIVMYVVWHVYCRSLL
jgi:hypothetical protein